MSQFIILTTCKDTKVAIKIEDIIYLEEHINTEDDIKRIKKEMAKRKMTDAICSFSARARQEYIPFEDLEKVYDLIVSLKK